MSRRRRKALLCGLLLLAGCGNEHSLLKDDPLFGVGPPARAAVTAPPARSPATGLPPIPAASSTTSSAALASGVVQPQDPSHDLRIGDANGGSGWRSGQGASLTKPPPAEPPPPGNVAPAIRVTPPPADSTSRSGLAPASFVPASGGQVLAFEQAQALLGARGVTWQRLETWGDTGEWKFSCSIPNRQNANIRRTYESRARDPLAAIRGALDQMSRDQ
ncbi:MAG TPA: hypothetical protein VFA26_09960 [Gemmataceae bacterium]|nr:hypothetical protein [Gemmataceae bacterium]